MPAETASLDLDATPNVDEVLQAQEHLPTSDPSPQHLISGVRCPSVPMLVLLNGPPACGKSTIAARFAESRPLTLNLDIDVVRGMLGGWLDDPSNAGLTARSLALAMAETHLATGRDVIVPQFLGRTDFIEQLADVADGVAATFVETALWVDRAAAITAFADRRAAPSSQTHLDAAALVDRSEHTDPVGQMYDAFVRVLDQRPATRRVDVVLGNIDETFARFENALDGRYGVT